VLRTVSVAIKAPIGFLADLLSFALANRLKEQLLCHQILQPYEAEHTRQILSDKSFWANAADWRFANRSL
jgi:hypothetical protein